MDIKGNIMVQRHESLVVFVKIYTLLQRVVRHSMFLRDWINASQDMPVRNRAHKLDKNCNQFIKSSFLS